MKCVDGGGGACLSPWEGGVSPKMQCFESHAQPGRGSSLLD